MRPVEQSSLSNRDRSSMAQAIDTLPAVFGRYLLLRRLSRGGMGEIFLAKVGEVEGFEKPVVIKKILPSLSRDQDFLHLFIEEAQIAIKLSHGNIVPVYEVGLVQGQYFLAMQYIEGRDLRALFTRAVDQRRRIPPDVALFLLREVANGLAYAHRRTDDTGRPLDLVHCDVSPPNVLVSFEGEVKVIDFGVAKSAVQRAQAQEDVGFGKFGYMAPEQLIRGATVDRLKPFEVDVVDGAAFLVPIDQVKRGTADAFDRRQAQFHGPGGNFDRLCAKFQCPRIGVMRIFYSKRHAAGARTVFLREECRGAARFFIQNEIDAPLTIQRDVFGAVLRNGGETKHLENGFQDAGFGGGKLNKLETVETHRIVKKIWHSWLLSLAITFSTLCAK